MAYKEKKAKFINSIRNESLYCAKIIESCKTIEQCKNAYKWVKYICNNRWKFYAEQICSEYGFSFRFHYIAESFSLYEEIDILYKELKETYFQKINEILGL